MIERLTTQEAARRLGVSVATVRRKIAAGELQGVQEARPQGARWYVLLPLSDTDHEPSHGTSHTAQQATEDRSEDASRDVPALMLERAYDEVAYLRKKLDEVTELLAREQQAHLQTRLMLHAPEDRSGSAHETSQAPDGERSDSDAPEPQAPPWWQFWRR